MHPKHKTLQLFLGLALLPVIFSACGKTPTAEPGKPVLHFTGDFETGDFSQFHLLVPGDTNARIVSNPVRKGTYSARFFLRPGDIINNGNRSELAVYNCAEYHTDVYYGWSFMIDTSWSDAHYCLLSQWQNLPNYEMGEDWNNTFPSPPPLALVYTDGLLEVKWNEKVVREDVQTIGSRNIGKGVWHDVVFRVYWSDQNDGFIEAWLDGSPLISGTGNRFYGANLYNRSGNYFKFGLYRGHDSDTYPAIIAFADELKIGSSYDEVKP